MPSTLDFYPALRLQRLGSVAVVQPVWDGGAPLPALTVDLETGTLAASEHPQVQTNYTPCFGVLGMLRLEGGPALVVITGVTAVRARTGNRAQGLRRTCRGRVMCAVTC
jgi:hypothetical protein